MQDRSATSFDTVWFSTDAQFDAFEEAFRDASRLQRLLGRYPVRPGAAYISLILQPWTRIPIVLVASGRLEIAYGRASFAARSRFGLHRNVRSDLAFSLAASEIKTLEAHLQRSPIDSLFELTWTRVETSRAVPLDNFYLSVGGRNAFSMSRYRRDGIALREALQRLRECAPAVAPAPTLR